MAVIPERLGRVLRVVAAAVVLAVAIVWGVHYWLVGQYLVGTDDAYVAADSTIIAPKISGYVTNVDVLLNQPVTKGQVLLTIDDRDYKAALAAARGAVASAHAAIANDLAQLSLQQARIAAAGAALDGDKARLAFSLTNSNRYANASRAGASTAQNAEQAATTATAARAQVAADQANLDAANKQVAVLQSDLASSQAALQQATAQQAQAALNLSHTVIRAPYDGVVGNKTVAVGDYLQPGTQVMAVVPLDQVYVLANYKETQLTDVAPGQKVSLSVDAYPGLAVHGTVNSISPASGQTFALLPPDNATGNFTKIVQRVPVKIVLDLTPQLIGKLRPGMSVEPVIDTRSSGERTASN